MSDTTSNHRLNEVLRSAAESLFPADDFVAPIDINTKSSDGDTPLHVFAWRGDVESAQVLIQAGADINAMGDMSETPLHIAVRKQNEPLVVLLLEAGAKTTIRSEFNQTAQEIAVAIGGSIGSLLKNRKSRCRSAHDA